LFRHRRAARAPPYRALTHHRAYDLGVALAALWRTATTRGGSALDYLVCLLPPAVAPRDVVWWRANYRRRTC